MISGLIDELNKSADEWNGSNMFELARMCREAADTIWKLRDDLQRANAENAKLRAERDEWHRVAVSKQDIVDHMRDARAENAKLRELVSGLEHCSQGFPCNRCPLYDPSGTNHHRCESLERELGIEVDE